MLPVDAKTGQLGLGHNGAVRAVRKTKQAPLFFVRIERAVYLDSTINSMNIVLDSASFFGDGSGDVTAIDKGLFKLSNDKSLVNFRLYWSGTGSGDKFVSGTGYFTGLAPSVSADQPLWVSPLTIDVAGDFTPGTVSA